MSGTASLARIGCALLAFAAASGAFAGDDPFKLTIGEYRYSDGSDALDANLRHSSGLGNAWVGYYHASDGSLSQWRSGWDRSFGEELRATPSVQLASGGFVGGSIQAEAGAPYFAGAGLGRTNLRPYVNLNFDPNDSYSLFAGRREDSGALLMLSMVRDNREHPDQRHFHFLYRQPLADGERFTLDTLYKVGQVEGEMIRRWGATATYDWPRFFARLAWDPKTNFTTVDSWRLSVGTRF